jgi:hypothetical protein
VERALFLERRRGSSPASMSLMFGVADDYEHLTQIAEAMALISSILASAIESKSK